MASGIRTLDGVDLPAAGEWIIDPGHVEVGFVGRHFGLTKVRGRFTRVSGVLVVGETVDESSLTVEIDMKSLSSGDDTRDDHLRSDDLFDVVQFPSATFTSTSVESQGTNAVVTGDLTIKDVTRPIALKVEYLGYVEDPWGNERAVFSASTEINREDWGLTWNMILVAGGLLVSKEIRIEIEVELIRQAP